MLVWRRLFGTFAMALGGALVIAMATLAWLLAASFVVGDGGALGALLLITAPSAGLGVALLLFGRWSYGEWSERAPVRRIAATGIKLLGVMIAAWLGGMLLLLIWAGIDPQDQATAANLSFGLIAGIAMTVFGVWMQPRRAGRRHED